MQLRILVERKKGAEGVSDSDEKLLPSRLYV